MQSLDRGSHHTRFSKISSWVGGEAFEYMYLQCFDFLDWQKVDVY